MDDRPRPDLTDQEALQILQSLALEFLNREETHNQGGTLWRVFCYLEERVVARQQLPPLTLTESDKPAGAEIQTGKEVIRTDGQAVVFIGCRIETLTMKGG